MTQNHFVRALIRLIGWLLLSLVVGWVSHFMITLGSPTSPEVYNSYTKQAHCTGTMEVESEDDVGIRHFCQGEAEVDRAIAAATEHRAIPFYQDPMFQITFGLYAAAGVGYFLFTIFKPKTKERIQV